MNNRQVTKIRRKKKQRINYLMLFIAVFLLTIAVVSASVFIIASVMDRDTDTTFDPNDTGFVNDTAESDTEELTTAPPVYESHTFNEDDSMCGTLILVNSEHKYTLHDKYDFTTIYERKSRDFKVATRDIELRAHATDAINMMMADFREETGLSDVQIYKGFVFADSGTNDHNSGYGFDFNVYTGQASYKLDHMPQYAWIMNNCHKYGIVRRYESHKSAITGVLNDEWHFRYVGVPHSYYMKEKDLCLEEYIAELEKYQYAGEHLIFEDDMGNKWEVFMAKLLNSGDVTIELPESAVFTVSGTNCGSVVVAIDITNG